MKKRISIATLCLCVSAPCVFASQEQAATSKDQIDTQVQVALEINKFAQSLNKMSPQSKTEFLVLLKNTSPSVYSVLTYQTLEQSMATNKQLMQQILANQHKLLNQKAG